MHHPLFHSRRADRAAFTLVELLAAMAVLTLLLVVVVQMINSVAAVTTGTSHHLDADSQARLVFDRMAADFAQIVKRLDVDYYFVKKSASGATPGNDQMAFYSETSGYYPSGSTTAQRSNAALVGYCISNLATQPPQLMRLNKALLWNGVTMPTVNDHPMTFLPQTLPNIWSGVFNDPSNPDMSASTDADYQVIGESVFRMEICYLMPNTSRGGTVSTVLSDTPYLVPGATPVPTTAPNPAATPYNGMRDTAAVVVTLAVLDGDSRRLIPSADQPTVLKAVALKLDDVATATDLSGTGPPYNLASTPAKLWQARVDSGALVGAGLLPRRAASQVRIYERYFPLGNAK